MNRNAQNYTESQLTAAAAWLARVDRGLSSAEQDAYRIWLAADPAHPQAIEQLTQSWQFCDKLADLRPATEARPDANLLAPRRRLVVPLLWGSAAAGLAALLFLAFALSPQPTDESTGVAPMADASTAGSAAEPSAHSAAADGDNLQVLMDGSVVRTLAGATIEVAYTATERRVRLLSGTAFFNVAHDHGRPFVVETFGVTVHALGTVFRVALQTFDVAVEVSEGSVEVRKDPDLIHADFQNGVVLASGEKVVLRYARLRPLNPPAPSTQPGD